MISRVGAPTPLRNADGPIAFGNILYGGMVPWSGGEEPALLTIRCHTGLFLFEASWTDIEQNTDIGRAEIAEKQLSDTFGTLMHSLAFSEACYPDAFVFADRKGFLHHIRRVGVDGEITFAYTGFVVDDTTKHPFHFEYRNPAHPILNRQSGFIEPMFRNKLHLAWYPTEQPGLDLIVGGEAGFLWWLPDKRTCEDSPVYAGTIYTKDLSKISTAEGEAIAGVRGRNYAIPSARLLDQEGTPFCLGEAVDGGERYTGSIARPFVITHPKNGRHDLIVVAGTLNTTFYYLERCGEESSGVPRFLNRGTIEVAGFSLDRDLRHSVFLADRGTHLWFTHGPLIAVFRKRSVSDPLKGLVFEKYLSADHCAGFNPSR